MDNLEKYIQYITFEKKYSVHTIKAYKDDIVEFKHFVCNSFNSETIDDTSYPQIRNWIVSLSDMGVANQSINRKIASLKSYFKFCLKLKK